jgi:hypothetical protein
LRLPANTFAMLSCPGQGVVLVVEISTRTCSSARPSGWERGLAASRERMLNKRRVSNLQMQCPRDDACKGFKRHAGRAGLRRSQLLRLHSMRIHTRVNQRSLQAVKTHITGNGQGCGTLTAIHTRSMAGTTSPGHANRSFPRNIAPDPCSRNANDKRGIGDAF